jgi:hypothetical protein
LEEQSNQYLSLKAYLNSVLFKLKSFFIIYNLNKRYPTYDMVPCVGIGLRVKRKEHGDIIEVEKAKRQAVEVVNVTDSGHCQDIQVWMGNL